MLLPCTLWWHADHGISQEEIDAAFEVAGRVFGQSRESKMEFRAKYPYVPETNLGYRAPEDMEFATGGW